MKRKVAAVTGATGGIGRALAAEAIVRGHDLVLHGRSGAKLDALKQRLAAKHPETRIVTIVGDLDSADGAYDVASRIAAATDSLDLLINNAGVLLDGLPISPDGIDMHTQVNLIAPYVMMTTLQPMLSMARGQVINVASGSAMRAKALSVQSLKAPTDTRKLFGAYAQSKLALALLTQTLAPEYSQHGILLVAADPGPVKSDMTAGNGMPGILKLLRPFLYATPEKGASQVFAAIDAEMESDRSGSFYPGGKRRDLPAFTRETRLGEEILAFCAAQAAPERVALPVQPLRIGA